MKCMQNAHQISQSSKERLQIALEFCSANGVKPKDSSFSVINKTEKQQILMFKNQEPAKY